MPYNVQQHLHFVAHRKRAHLLRLSLTIILAAGCLFQLVLYLSPPETHRISSHGISVADAGLLADLHAKLAGRTPTPTSPLNRTLVDLIESRLTIDGSAADTIALLWAPYSLRDFALNWLCHARKTGVTNYAFIVEEEIMEQYLIEIGEPVYMITGFDNVLDDGEMLEETGNIKNRKMRERIERKMTVVGQVLSAGYG